MAGPAPRLEDQTITPSAAVISSFVLSLFASALVLGCGDSSGDAGSAPEPGPAAFSEQVSTGKTVFMRSCAHCHGGSGEGGDAPRLVGRDRGALPLEPPAEALLRSGQFRTAADVANFVRENMPIDTPGSLADAEYYAVVAYLLDANGIGSESVLDAGTATSIELTP